MTDPFGRPLPAASLSGVVLPIDSPTRLLILDRTRIETRAWLEFGTADLLIDCRTPIVYTMARRNLVRLSESIAAALTEFDER
ncbi:hypothetical protein AB0L13_22530 [Saccharopolyspora shandongensis]|uniref:hypothetical protein n=1 Tax=Saccharopolyspora shandongensis TaxID=418495 RepID=UPI00342A6BAE